MFQNTLHHVERIVWYTSWGTFLQGLSDGFRSQFDQDIDFSSISFYHENILHVNLFPGNLFGSE